MYRILLIFNTLKYLKVSQVFFLIKFKVLKKNFFYLKKSHFYIRKSSKIWVDDIPKTNSMLSKKTFLFLNKKEIVSLKRGWNDKNFSKLWLYNLHYFDDLNSKTQTSDKNKLRLKLLNKWINNNSPFYGVGWEPYPISIRIINWIKWNFKGNSFSKTIKKSLFSQAQFLYYNLEKHLLGNHILTNAKALIFAGLFFKENQADKFYSKGIKIFSREINEQILSDGAHYELSPMYHSIVLEDLLDVINIHNKYSKKLSINLELIIKKMFFWLHCLYHPDSNISFFNDTALNIGPNLVDLSNYAKRLGIGIKKSSEKLIYLEESGFVYYKNFNVYLIANIGKIKADHQPGHSHAGTFSFELSLFNERLIVNNGISTYENNIARVCERSTLSHSTVSVDNQNSTEIWSSFRVARRPKIIYREVLQNESYDNLNIKATHDGYSRINGSPLHTRDWFLQENKLKITDQILGKGYHNIKIIFPLYPKVIINKINSKTIECSHKDKKIFFKFTGDGKIECLDSIFNYSFGLSEKNKKIIFDANQFLPFQVSTEVIW